MDSGKRIAINTIASYSRTLVAIVLVLFSSRWVLAELGVSDYGVFSLIGTILAVVTFVNNVLAASDARFYAIELGKDNREDSSVVFKSSLIIHLILPAFILVLGFFLGEFLIKNFFNIPFERVDSAIFVFRISLVAALVSLVAVPYNALFIAHQDIVLSSIIQLLQSFLIFLSAYFIRFTQGDKLIAYSLLYSCSQIVIYLLYILIANKKYNCCKKIGKVKVDKEITKKVLGFSFWNFLGDFGHLVRTQGVSIVVNLLFGPEGNATIGIANQVSTQANNIASALYRSSSPEVFRRAGSGDLDSANKLSKYTTKIGIMLMIMLAAPLIINMDHILSLWLINVPPFTKELCVCYIVMFVIERFASGQLMMLQAINKISHVQTVVFVGYCLSVVFPYCGLCNKFGLVGIGLSCIFSMIITRVGVIVLYSKEFKFDIKDLLFRLMIPIVILLLCMIALEKIIDGISLIYLMLSVIVSSTVFTFLFYLVAFSKEEKEFLLSKLKKS